MHHTSRLRDGRRNGFTKRALCALLLLVLLPAGASAYTLVLRDGRRLEIPEGFKVTRAGVTYEHSPGLYVTIQMTSIDVEATERANGERAGAFLERVNGGAKVQEGLASPSSKGASRRTLTDKELEGVRARRLQSEALYERRRQELGLPSLEETRRQRAEEARLLSERESETQASEAEHEAYWRARAENLRAAIAEVDAEINYLRSELRETRDLLPTVGFTTLAPFPFISPVPGRFPVGRFPGRGWRGSRPGFTERPIISGSIGFGGGFGRGRILFNGRGAAGGYRRPHRFGGRGVSLLPLPIYAPYSYDYSYDRSMLITRLRELEAERAGLQARWRLLEDEARRAGAPPGWLRP